MFIIVYLATRELEISSMGFQFLLLNKVEQIWTYLIYFFKYLEEKLCVDVFPVIEFFLKLLLLVTANEGKFKVILNFTNYNLL